MTIVTTPAPYFTDAAGDPLDEGYIYIGTDGLDARTNPITVYYDAALTVPAVQPIRTSGGYPTYQGAAKPIFVNAAACSMTVLDKFQRTNFNEISVDLPSLAQDFTNLAASGGSALVGFIQAGTGVEARTVQAELRDRMSVKQFGATGDGATDDHVDVAAAAQEAVTARRELLFPAGTYLRDTAAVRIEPTISDGDSVIFSGDGAGVTTLTEGDALNVGLTTDLLLYVNVPASVTARSVIVRDMTLDKNGASNGSLPSGAQQSHALRIYTDTTGLIESALVENVETRDKVAGGIVFAGGFIETAIVRNCHGRDFTATVTTERADFENQAVIDNLLVEGCSGSYAQSEPNVATASGHTPVTTYRNCTYETLELGAFESDVTAQTFIVDGCVSTTKLLLRDAKVKVINSRFQVDSVNYWRRVIGTIDNCTIINKYDSGANSISPFYPLSNAISTPGVVDLIIRDTVFEPGDGADGTTTGAAIYNASAYDGAQAYSVKLVDCSFSELYQQSLDAYRGGNYHLVRCKMGGTHASGGTVRIGGATTFYGNLILEDCDFSACTALYNINFVNSNTLWKLTLRGTHKYAEVNKFNVSGATQEDMCSFEGIITHTAAPTAGGIKGMVVTVINPVLGAGKKYACTTTHATAATWRMVEQNGVKKDTTANRITPNASDIGLLYLDTTLDADGKPIWWNGTGWFDATGAAV